MLLILEVVQWTMMNFLCLCYFLLWFLNGTSLNNSISNSEIIVSTQTEAAIERLFERPWMTFVVFFVLLHRIFAMGHPQHTTPVLSWNNLILGLCQTPRFHIKSKIKLLQINTSSDVSDKHNSNDIEGWWPLRIIKISKFRVFYYFVLFHDKYSFCNLF